MDHQLPLCMVCRTGLKPPTAPPPTTILKRRETLDYGCQRDISMVVDQSPTGVNLAKMLADTADVVICGAGPVGLLTALGLSQQGINTLVIGKMPSRATCNSFRR